MAQKLTKRDIDSFTYAGGESGAWERWVKKHTKGWLKKFLNRRGGLNGSWVSPERHYKHDLYRFPIDYKNFGKKWLPLLRGLDRIPDWLKASGASGGAGAAIAGASCGCGK